MVYFLLPVVIICIFMSLRTLFAPKALEGKFVSIENFLYLGTVYMTVIIGYGLIYLIFDLMGIPLLSEVYQDQGHSVFETSFYFSAMTLFSVGHGDVIPQGIGRIITVTEALIGYTLPAAFVAKALIDQNKK